VYAGAFPVAEFIILPLKVTCVGDSVFMDEKAIGSAAPLPDIITSYSLRQL
jgi:hypothetical protein